MTNETNNHSVLRILLKIVSTSLIIFVFFTSHPVKANNKVIRIGVFNYYPAVFLDSDGEIKGFYVDTLNHISSQENWNIEYVYGSWAEGLERIKNGEVDILTSVAFTKERTEFLEYGKESILTVWSEVYVSEKSQLHSILDMEDKSVAVMKNDFNAASFVNYTEQFGIEVHLKEVSDFDAIFHEIANGNADAGVVNNVFGTSKHQGFKTKSSGIVFNPFKIYFASAKGKNIEILNVIDNYLGNWKTEPDSFFHTAQKKWRYTSVDPIPVVPEWMKNTVLLLGFVVLICILFIWLLRRQVTLITKEKMDTEIKLLHSQRLESLGVLAGGIAHDFNNMLSGIMGAAEILKLGNTNLESNKYIDMILQSTEKAAGLSKKLLVFGRKEEVNPHLIDIHTIIRESLEILERTIDKKVEVTSNLRAEKSITLGDEAQLHNVFINLAINAAHAMLDGGSFTISTENTLLNEDFSQPCCFDIKQGNHIHISLQDTGTGISQENISRIFEPFFTTKSQGDGTGLGLSMVFGTVKNHNGAISVKSEPGSGTTFHIYLPVVESKAEISSETEFCQTGTGRILLVDDEEFIRITTKQMLESLNYSVSVAANGEEAVNIFKEDQEGFDLVILDMIMPIMSGPETFDIIKTMKEDQKIIGVSGFFKESMIDKMHQEGLERIISKPFRKHELSRLVAEVLKEENKNVSTPQTDS